MKVMKVILLLVVFLVGGVYGTYLLEQSSPSEQVAGQLSIISKDKSVKKLIKNDPAVKEFLGDAKLVEEDEVPFKTKEEAAFVLIQKVGISELLAIKSKVQNGSASVEEIIKTLEDKLTKEEMNALKFIAYKEFGRKVN